MKYNILLKKLTQLCAAQIAAGGSCELVPFRLVKICEKYGFTDVEFIINPNVVVGTATAPDGNELSSIQPVPGISPNFGKLDCLGKYSQSILEGELPSAEDIQKKIAQVNESQFITKPVEYIATILFGTGFAVAFGSNLNDAIVAVIASIVIAFLGIRLREHTNNMFVYNVVICLVTEFIIISSAKYLGFCEHPESITLGVIMILMVPGSNLFYMLAGIIMQNSDMELTQFIKLVTTCLGISFGFAVGRILLYNKLNKVKYKDFE